MELDLKSLLSNPDLSRKEKVLVILFQEQGEIPVKGIVEVAVSQGLIEAKKWNVSQILSSMKPLALKLPAGWAISEKGKQALSDLGVLEKTPTKSAKPALRKYSSKIPDEHVREFAEEAIEALEIGLLRSAVVLSWVGAVSLLYREVVTNHLADFNIEATKRFPKWKAAKNSDDLSKMKEYDFLQILNALSIIGKNVKSELEQSLKLRNSCGHPNSLKIGEHKVAAHIEILVLNVYSKYGI